MPDSNDPITNATRLELQSWCEEMTAENARLQGADQAVLRLLARVQAADALAEAVLAWAPDEHHTELPCPCGGCHLLRALAAYRATEVTQ